jgi:hypothetical protein
MRRRRCLVYWMKVLMWRMIRAWLSRELLVMRQKLTRRWILLTKEETSLRIVKVGEACYFIMDKLHRGRWRWKKRSCTPVIIMVMKIIHYKVSC